MQTEGTVADCELVHTGSMHNTMWSANIKVPLPKIRYDTTGPAQNASRYNEHMHLNDGQNCRQQDCSLRPPVCMQRAAGCRGWTIPKSCQSQESWCKCNLHCRLPECQLQQLLLQSVVTSQPYGMQAEAQKTRRLSNQRSLCSKRAHNRTLGLCGHCTWIGLASTCAQLTPCCVCH